MDARTQAASVFAASLGAPTGAIDGYSLERAGREIHVQLRRGKESVVLGAFLRVRIGQPLTGNPLLVRRETAADRFGKRIGINREFQTGDREFDQACYIEADIPPNAIRGVMERPGLREIVLRLVQRNGVTQFIVEPDGHVALYVPFEHFAWVATVQRALDELPRVVDILDFHRPPTSGYRGADARQRAPDLRKLSGRRPFVLAIMALGYAGTLAALLVNNYTPTPALEWSWR